MKKPYPTSILRVIVAVLLLVLFAFSLRAQNITPIKPQTYTAQQTAALNAAAQTRLPKAQACMEIKQPAVKLVLWDCGIEDNDTVSINLNGQWILQHFRLTNAKQEIDITLAPGENQLTLFANNLGDIPDNTAAMAIKENGVEQKATLSSNLLTSATMRLLVKGSNPATQMLTGCPNDQQMFMDDENQQVRANPDLANPQFKYLYSGLQKYPYETPRQLEMQGCTNVSDSIVTLYFWDSGVEDNDTISVNLNGVWVVQNMRLSKQKQSVQVKLQPGSNYVVMYANNLGDIPNNTSGVGVEYKFGKQDLGTMYSDKNTNGTFRFNCTAGASPAMASSPCIKTANNTNNHPNDPEMQYLYGTKTNTTPNSSQQPTQYTPQQQPNYAPALGTGIAIGVGVISTIPRGNSGSSPSGNTGTSGSGSRQRNGNNNPAPTRNPDKPINY
jgi:hypothetical protein